MTIKVHVSFDIEVDSPATITAYGITLGYALRSAAIKAVKVADKRGAEVSMGKVNLELTTATGERRG
jgi:hypothetical protein